LIVHVADGTTVEPLVQVEPVAIAKSPELVPAGEATVVICSVEPPGLVSVIVEALLAVPTPCAENAIGVLGDRVAAGGVTPESATVWVEPVTPLLSSVKVRVAARVPLAVGMKVTLQLQLAFAATVPTVLQSVPPAGAASA